MVFVGVIDAVVAAVAAQGALASHLWPQGVGIAIIFIATFTERFFGSR